MELPKRRQTLRFGGEPVMAVGRRKSDRAALLVVTLFGADVAHGIFGDKSEEIEKALAALTTQVAVVTERVDAGFRAVNEQLAKKQDKRR